MMAIRVAVVSSDGKFINQHFGRAEHFYIFALNETEKGSFRYLERRSSPRICFQQQHDENMLESVAGLLADCQVVLASRIGPGARRALAAKKILALEAPEFIGEALHTLGHSAHRIIQEG